MRDVLHISLFGVYGLMLSTIMRYFAVPLVFPILFRSRNTLAAWFSRATGIDLTGRDDEENDDESNH